METLARVLARRSVAWVVFLLVLALGALAALQARQVEQDDDLLAFLPDGNPEVAAFGAINDRFGALDVALVGIPAADPFDGRFLAQLRRLTDELRALPSVDYALSLANVDDFRIDPVHGGIDYDYLIAELPETAEQKAALRGRVMSRQHIVGNLVSPKADAVLLYCFLSPKADPRAAAGRIKATVERVMPEGDKYWGGSPFISTYIYDITQADMKRLIPWAVLVIVLIVVVSFRDLVGSVLALLSPAIAIAVTRGLMGLFGVRANIVLSSMPVILFAVGSAYGVHVLARYYALRRELDCEPALVKALVEIGPTVLAAGLTTVAGLLSFLWMDIEPMQSFGLFTALGILAALVLSLTFIPAVIRLAALRARQPRQGLLGRLLLRLSLGAQAHRRSVGAALLLLGAAGLGLLGRVEARMENAAFFAEDSPPDRAERFLREHFGGSQFIQLEVAGDMTDPHVLRELGRIADRAAVLPHVSSVSHVGQVLSLGFEAWVDERRLPQDARQVQALYRPLEGRAAIRQLVTDQRDHALINVKIDTDRYEQVNALLQRVERLAAERASGSYRIASRERGDGEAVEARLAELVLARLAAHARSFGVILGEAQRAALGRHLGEPAPEADSGRVRARLLAYLRSDESILEPAQKLVAEPVAEAVAALGPAPSEEALTQAVGRALDRPADDELVDDLSLSMESRLEEIWRQLRSRARAEQLLARAAIVPPEGEQGDRFVKGVADALLELDRQSAMVAAEPGAATGRLDVVVNGLPVLHRGLSNSVTANQFKSLGLALALVLVILCVLYRSLSSGLLAATPTALTLLFVYGLMGAAGVHLDIGTSMLASIIIGAGVDYAVHLLAAWRAGPREPLERAAERAATGAGPAIWTNALMVAAGFFVLTLGQARPLQNVGSLTATAMVTAGLVTFVALPVLARRRRYGRQRRPLAKL